MNKFQNLAAINIENLQTLLSTEIDSYAEFWEPGSPAHASIVEYIDRIVAVLPRIAKETSPKQAAYVLRRTLRGLRRASFLQTNEEAACILDGLHADPEACLFGIVYPDGRVTTSVSRRPVSNLGAYCRAIEAKTGAAVVFPWEPTAADNLAFTTSRSWK